jgi:glutathione S-transferase
MADATRLAARPNREWPRALELVLNESAAILERLEEFGPVLAIKLYRLTVEPSPPVPSLPCLDHEAMLHARIAPHLAAYLQDRTSGDIHETVFILATRRIGVDIVSTWGERSPESHQRLLDMLARRFPDYRVAVTGPSWWRGERRVADACRAQVSLREVLLGHDFAEVKARIDRLQTIGSLMEKQSRVASWGVRTVTGPLLTAAGVVTFVGLGALDTRLGESSVTWLRYSVVGLIGAVFLYYGMKAVQLTEMANRVWKRTAEYALILAERRRLTGSGAPRA